MAKMGFEENRAIHYDWHNVPTEFMGIKFKSIYESKWAKYLEILKSFGAIISWEYEPDTFDCGVIYGKKRIYTPDFKVVEKVRRHKVTVYHETKTYLRQKDISRFRWLNRAHSDIMIVLVADYCRKKAKQALLRQQAQKYVVRITYANPIFRQYSIK